MIFIMLLQHLSVGGVWFVWWSCFVLFFFSLPYSLNQAWDAAMKHSWGGAQSCDLAPSQSP